MTDAYGSEWECSEITNDGHKSETHNAAWVEDARGQIVPAVRWPVSQE